MNEIYFSLGALGIGASAYAYLAWQRAKYSKAFDAAFTAVLDTVTNNEADAEIARLRNLCADIAAQETDGANATVKRMAALARAGCAK
jgi:Flp pilus assembly protein TadB